MPNDYYLPDPWSIKDSEWSDDVVQLPDITYGDVWNFLIETPIEFNGEK